MHPRTQTYKQACTHPQQKSKFLSCCCDTIQQKQVSLVSINYQRGSCWILALYYSWRGCASCWQLGAMFIIAPLCCQKHDGFQAFILKDIFFSSILTFFSLSFMVQLCCYTNNSISIYFLVALSRGMIKQYTYQVTSWVKFISVKKRDWERKMEKDMLSTIIKEGRFLPVLLSLSFALFLSINTCLNIW